MSPDHAITPDIINERMAMLTGTQDRESSVMVQPHTTEEGLEVARIFFICDHIGVAVDVLPVHLLLPTQEFSERVLEPLSCAWIGEKARQLGDRRALPAANAEAA